MARFYLLLDGFTEDDVRALRKSLDKVGRAYEFVLLRKPEQSMAGFASLHGSLTVYYRLLLPKIVPEHRLLYLDTDTLTTLDAGELLEIDLGGKPLAANLHGQAHTALDGKALLRFGVAPLSPVFNSGVLFFDIDGWNRHNLTDECIDFCRQHGEELTSHDQTALNVKLQGLVFSLPEKYNRLISPSDSRREYGPSILHFVASPKPFDLMGGFISPNSLLYARALRDTALLHDQKLKYFRAGSYRRALKIRRSYVRTLMVRLGLR